MENEIMSVQMILYAMRYAYDRDSVSVMMISEYLKQEEIIKRLSVESWGLISKDIDDALNIGVVKDENKWIELQSFIQEIISNK